MRCFSKWSGQESAPFWFVSKYLFIDFSGRFFWERTDGSLSISVCLGRGAAMSQHLLSSCLPGCVLRELEVRQALFLPLRS